MRYLMGSVQYEAELVVEESSDVIQKAGDIFRKGSLNARSAVSACDREISHCATASNNLLSWIRDLS